MSRSRSLDRPIFIVGAARSGTTMLAQLLRQHPDVAFRPEPKYVWRYRRQLAPDDRRPASDATPPVTRYIQKRFVRYTQQLGRTRFAEKTPSNCLRVPFVHAVFPDGRFLHIVRDGRDVALSAQREWTARHKGDTLLRRVRNLDIPARDLPRYLPVAAADVVRRQLRPTAGTVWGPRTPGLAEIRESQGVLPACVVQWRDSVEEAVAGFESVPAEQQFWFRYEDFVADPVRGLAEILEFCELRPVPELFELVARRADPSAAGRWRRRPDHEDLDRLVTGMGGATLGRFGYLDDGGAGPSGVADPEPGSSIRIASRSASGSRLNPIPES